MSEQQELTNLFLGIKSKLRPPFKIHGGKFYLAEWIISLFPKDYKNLTYIEPFLGGGSVFLNKKISRIEILNDLDKGVIEIFKAIKETPNDFIKAIKKLDYVVETFENAKLKPFSAVNEFVLRRMSRGGLKKSFAWSERKRGGMPGDINAWKTLIETIPAISRRLQNTFILNQKAEILLKEYNVKDSLAYVDPPYDPESRISKEAYEYELTEFGHIRLAEVLKVFPGKVILSGYQSELYSRLYRDWRCAKKEIVNHSSQQKTKSIKTECCWMNF